MRMMRHRPVIAATKHRDRFFGPSLYRGENRVRGSACWASIFQIFAAFWLCSSSLGAAATDQPVTLLADSYEFAFLGGLRETYEEFVLSPSHTLSITRTYTFHRDEPPHTCSYPIPSCGRDDVVHACDLKAVLSDEHVLALWPVEGDEVYGFDRRPQDGVVFSIEALGKGRLTVAELCREDGADCSVDHQALLRLRKTFTDLIDQAVSSSECASLSR